VDAALALQKLAVPGANGASFGASATGTDSAIGWVETARGLLVHRVRLDGERIADYRIVAPTEWNFHPEGAFSRGAEALDAADPAALEADVRRLVASLDPCVGVRYEAGHA
jgi:Ni,Fe-hydrogenase I large subunit